MRKNSKLLMVAAAVVLWPGMSLANSDVQKLTKDPANWAIWGGDYAGTRFSQLDQINAKNAKDLRVAWTFSTGVLRGHEGGPLVIGDTMYVHTPFPNKVFSINLKDQSINWKYEPKQNPDTIPVMCCDTVYRGLAYADGRIFLQQADTTLVALDAKTGKEIWKVKNGDPKKGETNTNAPVVVKDKVLTGISGGEFGVRGFVAAYNIKDGSLAWKAYSTGPDNEMLVDPEKTTAMLQAHRQRLQPQNLEGRPVEDRWWHDLGLVFIRPRLEPGVLRLRQPEHLESDGATRRQQVVHDHHGA